MRQKIAHLIQQIDAQIIVGYSDMDVHAADQQPMCHRLQIFGQQVIALLVRMLLLGPTGEWVSRSSYRRQSMPGGCTGYRRSQSGQVHSCLANRGANSRFDFNLRPQEFARGATCSGCDKRLTFVQQFTRR